MSKTGIEGFPNYGHIGKENFFAEDRAAQLIFEHLHKPEGRGRVGLDVDGVIFSGIGTQADMWIHPDTAETLIGLNSNFDISLITARNTSIMTLIMDSTTGQVDLTKGKHSFDKGCIRYDGTSENPMCPLISEKYLGLLKSIDKQLFEGPGNNATWTDVFNKYHDWCQSDPRWQSAFMRSIWYRYNDPSTKTFITNFVTDRAERFKTEISLTHHGQPKINLAWSKISPKEITKASPIINDQSMLPDIYLTDGGSGEKDTILQLQETFQDVRTPLIVVIGESPDAKNDDMDWCRDTADILIPTVDQTYRILQKVNAITEQQRS